MDTKTEAMRAWQRNRLEKSRLAPLPATGAEGVTVVAYHFWPVEKADVEFAYLECAIRETWRHCGLLPVVLIVDKPCDAVTEFASAHPREVTVRKSPCLRPGSVPSMSVDCNANLAQHFDTENVLVVQNDGFPLQPGLDRFIGKWDYIGAPYIRNRLLTRIPRLWPQHAVGNGGFSIRTRKICALANERWTCFRHLLPTNNRFTNEDDYYCLVLPLLSRSYRKKVSFAPLKDALAFSYDDLYEAPPPTLPFGFHGAKAFSLFRKRGWIPDP